MALAENIDEAPERSRFFPSATSTTIVATLPRSTSKAKRPIYKKEDTILMSDDSIVDALLELPDEDSWNPTRSTRMTLSLDIYRDNDDDTQITPPRSLAMTPDKTIGDSICLRDDNKQPATSMLTSLQRIGVQALKLRTKHSAPANPAFVPLPKVDTDEKAAPEQLLGSEDLIIPDSDGENSPLQLATTGDVESTAFNLSRFRYV